MFFEPQGPKATLKVCITLRALGLFHYKSYVTPPLTDHHSQFTSCFCLRLPSTKMLSYLGGALPRKSQACSFLKNKIDSEYQKNETDQVIPSERFGFEKDQ